MNEINKIKPMQYVDFTMAYQANRYPNQRFGQAFLNVFYPDLQDNKLFYEENYRAAVDIITDKYVYYGVGTPYIQLTDDE